MNRVAKRGNTIPQTRDSDEDREETKCRFLGDTECGKKIDILFDGIPYVIFSSIVMVLTLFADDVREVGFAPSADIPFSILNLALIAYYTAQIVLMSLTRRDYFLSFYFWLDFFSTITMIFDLIWITNLLTGGGRNAANIAQISKASRAARLGARTIKLIRILRLIRLMKLYREASQKLVKKTRKLISKRDSLPHLSSVVKARLNSIKEIQRLPSRKWTLLKNIAPSPRNTTKNLSINLIPLKEEKTFTLKIQPKGQNAKSQKVVFGPSQMHFLNAKDQIKEDPIIEQNKDCIRENAQDQVKMEQMSQSQEMVQNEESNQQFQAPRETKVASKINDQLQKNIILLIILILVSVPLLDANTWFSVIQTYDWQISQLQFLAQNDLPSFYSTANIYIANWLTLPNSLVSFSIPLSNGTIALFPDHFPHFAITASDLRQQDSDDYLSASGLSTITFNTYDYNVQASYLNIGRTLFVCVLLLTTSMLFSNDIESTALEPLQEMFNTVRRIAVHPLNALKQIQEKNMCLESITNEEDTLLNTEPRTLQNAIVKIGSLLAVGFGEAGTEIICRVIEDPSIINVMIPGRKIMAIFGFCDIRNFTDATEVLEADVMVFVNEIAQICHRVVYEHLGSPNKNIGDAFLLVWKFQGDDVREEICGEQKVLELQPTKRVRQTADLAVLSFVRMIAQITKAQGLQKYKHNYKLQQRIKDYKGVKMGFGMHVGWAIEGPIGSEYKIDASYLSPHVHMASRLEAATKDYGVPMLITHHVQQLTTTPTQGYLRQVDHVTLNEGEPPMDLYTVDLAPQHFFAKMGVKYEKELSEREKKILKVYRNTNRQSLLSDIESKIMTEEMWKDEDIHIMREPYTKVFYQNWQRAFDCYLKGQWSQAQEHFKRTLAEAPAHTDGPSESLLNYMAECRGVPPANWNGVRLFI